MRDSKTKLYHLKVPKNPEAAVIVLTKEDIKKKPVEFKALINSLGDLEGEKIPNSDRIVSAEICFYYERHHKWRQI